MTVYCVMEDWCNNQPMPEDFDCNKGTLCAIFNTQHEALNNVLIGVDRNWSIANTDSNGVWLSNRDESFDPEYDVEETLHRYIKSVEIGKLVY